MLSSLEKFGSVFGLKLGYLLFGATEQLSRALHNRERIRPRITIHDYAQRQSSINFTSHVSLFQRVSLANQCCHDTGEPLPGLMTELLLTCLNVRGITIGRNTMKPAEKLKTQLESRFNEAKLRGRNF